MPSNRSNNADLFVGPATDAAGILVAAVKDELQAQGHVATGRLMKSIRGNVEVVTDGVDIVIGMIDYGRTVNNGLPPGTWVNVIDLYKWVKIRGFLFETDKEAMGIAYAIQRKIHDEGSPTSGAAAYSTNGRRTEFLTHAVDEKLDEIQTMIADRIGKGFELQLQNMIQEVEMVQPSTDKPVSTNQLDLFRPTQLSAF